MASIGIDVFKARKILIEGGLVGIPTETVYGLAGNALNELTISRIFEVKNRPTFDPLIVHVGKTDHLKNYADEIPQKAIQLMNKFWPGPLTILLKKSHLIPDLVTSGMQRAGFRCPDHELTLSLLNSISFPLAAPSANPFGYISPTTAKHVNDQLGDKIEYILDGGACKVGVESTIIGFENEETVIYRLGGIPIEEIEFLIGKVRIQVSSSQTPSAPGQLTSHYAPSKQLIVGDLSALQIHYSGKKFGILSFSKEYHYKIQKILSPSGNTTEAARNLFRCMRELDEEDIDFILAEWVPEIGLGNAINDRLRRAAAQK